MPDQDEPMHGIGDLALALGGSEDSFTGRLLQLIAKADPQNRERLRLGYPRIVRAWELWMSTTPTPTSGELLFALDQPTSSTSSSGLGGIWDSKSTTAT